MSFRINIDIGELMLGLITIYFFVFLHEGLHGIFIPNSIKSSKTVWGLQWFGAFITTTEEISKARFIVISSMPYILLSLALPLVLKAFGSYSGFLIFIFIVNAAGS